MAPQTGRSVATVYVSLALTANRLSNQIKKELQDGLKGVNFDKGISEPISKGTESGAKDGAKKGNRAIKRELPKGTDKLGKKIANGLNKSLKGAAKGMKIGVGAIGGGIAAGIGTALTAGFKRLSAIENAKASISGLGYSLETVEKVGTNALDAVRGTAFGLGDAYAAAARGLGAGVKEGKEMEKYLSAISNITTLAGANFSEVSAVLGKMAANGKVSGETLAQLEDRGFGASAALAKHFEVSQQEVRKMISDGEVSMNDFMKVMEQYEGAALKSGDTTAGALANTGAAFGRLGVALMGDSYEMIRLFAIEITTAVDGVADAIRPAMDKINADIRENFGGGLEGSGQRFADYLMNNQQAISDFLLNSYENFKTSVGNIVDYVNNMTLDPNAALTMGLSIIEDFTAALLKAMESTVPIIELIGETGIMTLMSFITQLTIVLEAITPILEKLTEWWNSMDEDTQSAIAGIIAFGIALGWTFKLLAPIFNLVRGFVGGIVKSFKALKDPTSAFRTNMAKMGKHLPTFSKWFQNIGSWISRIAAWARGFAAAMGLARLGVAGLVIAFAALIGYLAVKIPMLLTGYKGTVREVIGEIFTAIGNGLVNLWNGVVSIIKSIGTAIRDMFRNMNLGQVFSVATGGRTRQSGIPQMATGGDVLAPTLLLAGEKDPETIVNRGVMNELMSEVIRDLKNNRNGNNGGNTQAIHIEVHPSDGMDERELADMVYRRFEWDGRY